MILTNQWKVLDTYFLMGLKIHFIEIVVIGLHEAILIHNYY